MANGMIGRFLLFMVLGALSVLVVTMTFPQNAEAATFTVNSTGDEKDDDTSDGICATAGGLCTLTAAIMQANKSGTTSINFNIPGQGPHTIRPRLALEKITVPITIVANKDIILDGTDCLTCGGPGLHIAGGNSVVRGMIISGWNAHGDIIIEAEGNNQVENNFFATNATGEELTGGGVVKIVSSPNNLIKNNVFGMDGVQISGVASTGNRLLTKKLEPMERVPK